MLLPNTPLPSPSPVVSRANRRRSRVHRIGCLLLGAGLGIPCSAGAQTAGQSELDGKPSFSQTAPAPATSHPEAASVAPVPSSPIAAPSVQTPVAVSLPLKQRTCTCDWVRDGFYLRVSSGAAYARFSGDGPSGSTRIAGLGDSTTVSIGGSVARGLVLAGTIQVAEVTDTFRGGPYADAKFTANGNSSTVTKKADATSAQIGALVDWYPLENWGLHVGMSAGIGVVSVVNQADDSSLQGTDLSGSLFVGYDWPIASTFALGVSLVASGGTTSSLKDDDSKDTSYKIKPASLGLAASLLYF